MILQTDVEKEIIEYASRKNALIDGKAVKLLATIPKYKNIIDELIEDNTFLIDEKKVKEKIIQKETKVKGVKKEVIVKKTLFKAEASEIEPQLKILKELDVTGQSCSEGKIKDFLHYFRDKYKFLHSVLKQRVQLNPKAISQLKKLPKNTELDLIAMVSKKWISKNGHQAFQLEDLEEECIAVVSKKNENLTALAQQVLLDDVIGVKGTKVGERMIIIKEIIWPDLPQKPIKKVERDLSVVAISDMHIGSKLFLEKEFNKFLSWLNGGIGSKKEIERIGKIKYLLVVGDNVDGVGIYPDQFDELAIKDIYKQYRKFSELILSIPEYIEVVICPGQHDAVRRADPQPAIAKEFVPELYDLENVHFVGSPGWISIEGLKTLIYHGASLHDLYASVNFLSTKEPQKAIIEVLKRRDLMPSYGLRQPYVPEKKDFMLIREEPDLYFGGDMHHNGYALYRNCLIVNSGTWQTQTEFQKKEGHFPTPGIAAEINLKTRKIRENYFYREGE